MCMYGEGMKTSNQIREAIKQAMAKNNVTMYGISKQVEVSYDTIHRLIEGDGNPRLENLQAMCDQLGLILVARKDIEGLCVDLGIDLVPPKK